MQHVKQKKYIAAVSGGPDSMAMLNMYKNKITLVCHVNYKKRLSADRDEKIVREFCKQNNIKICVLIVNKQILNKYKSISNNFQNIARLIRYDFFNDCALKENIHNLLIAHNKDDFIETALMQKRRNTNALFLGIKPKNTYKDLAIDRPLINKWKNDLLIYCQKNHIPYGIDESNNTDLYERNKVRKEISSWTVAKKNKFFEQIINFNNKNKKKVIQINNLFDKWKVSNFSINQFKKSQGKFDEYLIYQYLTFHNLNKRSSNKIKLIKDFILSSKTNIKLRLENNKFILKTDKLTIK